MEPNGTYVPSTPSPAPPGPGLGSGLGLGGLGGGGGSGGSGTVSDTMPRLVATVQFVHLKDGRLLGSINCDSVRIEVAKAKASGQQVPQGQENSDGSTCEAVPVLLPKSFHSVMESSDPSSTQNQGTSSSSSKRTCGYTLEMFDAVWDLNTYDVPPDSLLTATGGNGGGGPNPPIPGMLNIDLVSTHTFASVTYTRSIIYRYHLFLILYTS